MLAGWCPAGPSTKRGPSAERLNLNLGGSGLGAALCANLLDTMQGACCACATSHGVKLAWKPKGADRCGLTDTLTGLWVC